MSHLLVDGPAPLLVVPAIAALAVWRRAVDVGGAVAGCAVATAMALGAGWAGVAMLFALLAIGTAVTPHGGARRNAVQVLANGGVAGAAALAAACGAAAGVAAAAGALAAALSDTVSSELGKRFGGAPRAMLLGRAMARGADGGMTWTGTALGVAGALPVPIAGLALGALPGPRAALGVAVAGLLGNLLDSAFGLLVQPRLGPRGNDWCNLFATACGALSGALLTSP